MDEKTNRCTEVLNERGVNIQVLKRGQFSSVDNRGKTRPISVSAFEDKLVQDAVRIPDRIVNRGRVKWILEVSAHGHPPP